MIRIWQFIFGYLTIKIIGNSGELVLNNAAKNNIKIWNLCYKNGCIFGNISPKEFLKLYKIKRGINCKIAIISKHGLAFRLKKYKKRIGIIIGLISFFVVLAFFSNFIWIIEVTGNNTIPKNQILDSCKKVGIYEGVYKNKIHNKYDAHRLQLLQNDIAWCSLNVEGSVLTVNVSEVAQTDEKERENPSNIKASTTGKITKINVTSGNVLVKVGDTVSRGDLLVSGIMENLSSTLFVHSNGEIIAETERVFSAKGNYNQSIKTKTDDIVKRISIEFFKFKIPLFLGPINKEYDYEIQIDDIYLFKKKVPIRLAFEKYTITQTNLISISENTLKKQLYNDIKNQVEKFDVISAVELNQESIKIDDGILLKITYKCQENIAAQDTIILSKEN